MYSLSDLPKARTLEADNRKSQEKGCFRALDRLQETLDFVLIDGEAELMPQPLACVFGSLQATCLLLFSPLDFLEPFQQGSNILLNLADVGIAKLYEVLLPTLRFDSKGVRRNVFCCLFNNLKELSWAVSHNQGKGEMNRTYDTQFTAVAY